MRLIGVGFSDQVREPWRRGRRHALGDEWLELTSDNSRRQLAQVCRRYVSEIRDPLCRASAVNRFALREHVGSLARLGARLSDLGKPVSADSILLARDVVAGNGPLFNGARADELGPALERALQALTDDETSPDA